MELLGEESKRVLGRSAPPVFGAAGVLRNVMLFVNSTFMRWLQRGNVALRSRPLPAYSTEVGESEWLFGSEHFSIGDALFFFENLLSSHLQRKQFNNLEKRRNDEYGRSTHSLFRGGGC